MAEESLELQIYLHDILLQDKGLQTDHLSILQLTIYHSRRCVIIEIIVTLFSTRATVCYRRGPIKQL